MDNKLFYEIKDDIFHAAFGRNGKCFLLIDAALEKYQSDSFLYDLLKNYECYPIIFHHGELQDALPLYFVSLDVQNEKDIELFNNSIRHAINELASERIAAGEGRVVCAWISTQLTQEQLSDNISRFAVQSVQSSSDILIRYFDPSVLGLFLPILDEWQKKQLLSNINTWCYIDGDSVAQIINGDGSCVKKLNHSLGLTESNALEMKNIVVINKILRKYRGMKSMEQLSEQQVANLLHPALRYFYSHFSWSDNGVIEFGLDVLTAQRLFYQNGVFERFTRDNHIENLPEYSQVKSKIEKLVMKNSVSVSC